MEEKVKYSPLTEVYVDREPISPLVKPSIRWRWGGFVVSLLTSLLCSLGCGLVALAHTLAAYSDHKTGDYSGSRRKRRIALCFNIAAVVFGVVSIIVYIYLMKYMMAQVREMIEAIQHPQGMQSYPQGMQSYP